MRRVAVSLAAALAAGMSSPAAAADTLAECSSIVDPEQRLACYDALSAPATPAAPVGEPPSAAPPPPAATVEPTPSTQTPQPAASVPQPEPRLAPVPEPGEAQSAEDRFGAERLQSQENSVPDEITAQMVGTFEGFRKGLVLTLDNGQRWRVTRAPSPLVVQLDSPRVRISKSFFGSYRVRIEDYNTRAYVERIR